MPAAVRSSLTFVFLLLLLGGAGVIRSLSPKWSREDKVEERDERHPPLHVKSTSYEVDFILPRRSFHVKQKHEVSFIFLREMGGPEVWGFAIRGGCVWKDLFEGENLS